MIQPQLIIDLFEASKADTGRVGGKAANLGELIDKGFPVPTGFIITTAAYALFVDSNNLNTVIESELAHIDYRDSNSIEEHAARIRNVVESAKLPQEIISKIEEYYKKMGEPPVAVRSSGTVEDLSSASFAGQLETYLNVESSTEVVKAIIKCYASQWSDRVLSYSNRSGFNQRDVKLAVLIQQMIPSKSAGVMFTTNPLSIDGSDLLIESTFGLGEVLVSGKTTPDKYLLKRNDAGSYRILDKQISTKKTISQSVSGGVEYVSLDTDQSSKPSLKDEQVLKLAELGHRIQITMGAPQDIEWAIDEHDQINILQSRPITTLRTETKDETVWTRGYSDDYWNDPVSPLFFDLLGNHLTKYVNVELNKIMGYKSLNSEKTRQLLRLHKAHAYFNLDVLKIKVENEIPPFLRNDDVLNYFPEGSSPYGKESMKKLRFNTIGRIWAEIRVTFKDPNGKGNKTADTYYKWTNNVFDPYYSTFNQKLDALKTAPITDYINLADEVDEIMVSHFRLVRYGIPVHNIGMNLLTQYLLARFLGMEEGRRVYPILISGLEHKTSRTNDGIDELASTIRLHPELQKMILETSSETLYESISKSNSAGITQFRSELDDFLAEYGVRSFTREIYYPRWSDETSYLFDIFKSLASGDPVDVEAAKESSKKLRIETGEIVKKKINNQFLGFAKWGLLSNILESARRYIIFREQQRFNLDKWITMNRRLYLTLGDRLVKKGHIAQSSDIFFLTKSEIRDLTAGKTDKKLRSTIESRREDFLKYENTTPPKFLHGNREFNDPYTTKAGYFKGIPASQGVLTATVRVLENIEEIWQVQVGEILVVPRTDPGWTPVFSKIGGLITETGGILSHGAVVSREYGIPAVTNIHDACRVFQTGQRVTIDGVKGEVTIEN
jgi:rifampicin phosphotransferase